jgi:hypothetical protein
MRKKSLLRVASMVVCFLGTVAAATITYDVSVGYLLHFWHSGVAGYATRNLSGTPYVKVPGIASLAAGQSVTVSVQLRNPSNVTLNLTPDIYSGSIN